MGLAIGLKIVGINESAIYSKAIRPLRMDKIRNEIAIMPNPISNWAQLYIRSAINSDAYISIYNINGEKIYSQHIGVQQGGNNITLSEVSEWARGTYQAVIQLGGDTFFRKIIVAR